MTIFRSFRSTVTPFLSRKWPNNLKLLVDPITGAPTGIESVNANGPHGIWTPVDLTAAQIASPTAEMIADLNATYRLNVSPYTRYHSDGNTLVAAASGTSPGGLFNVTPQNMSNWRKAVANVRAGTGRATLLMLGDSTTMGVGAGTGTNNLTGAYAKNYPRDLAALLAKSVPVMDNSFFCDQASAPVAYGTYDSRVTLGTGWGVLTGTLGGNTFRFTVGVAGLLTFTPVTAFDRIKVWYVNTGAATATINVDGGASLGTITVAGGNTVTSQTFNCALATHTINLTPGNDAAVAILGMITWNSAVPAVDFIQAGVSGAKASYFIPVAPPFAPGVVLPQIAPDLTVIDLTINDSNAPTDLTLYTSEMQTIITNCKLSGDVLLMVGAPSNSVQATNGTLDQFAAALQSLAISNNCGLLNIKTRWVSYAVTNPILPYFDLIHPGPLGYQDIAQAVFGAISP